MGILPPRWDQSHRDPQGISLYGSTSYDVQIVKIGPLVFAQLTLLSNPSKAIYALQLALQTLP